LYGCDFGNVNFKDQQGHSNRKDAVAKSRQALDALPGL
jgi:hypothetical protein